MTASLIKMVQVFSDRRGADLTTGVCSRWRGELPAEQCCQTDWNTELFRSPKLRLRAAREAADANVVIVAAREGTPLPPEIRDWLALWRNRGRSTPASLVVLLRRDHIDSPRVVERFLHDFARKACMDFLCHSRVERECSLPRKGSFLMQ